jgi:hypothetical protein
MGSALSSNVFEAVLYTQPVHPSELQLGNETENVLSERRAYVSSPSISSKLFSISFSSKLVDLEQRLTRYSEHLFSS